MYNVLLGIQYASIALMLFMCAYITKRWKKPLHGWLFFYCTMTLINNAGYLAFMLAHSEEASLFALQICYLGRTWISFSLFQFILVLCNKKRPIWLMNILALFHATTYFLMLFVKHNTLYYKSYAFVEDGLFPHITHTNGIWHYLYDVVILSYIVIAFVILFRSIHAQKNPRKKRQLNFIIAAFFTDSIFFVLQFFRLIPGYDLTVLGYTFATVFLYVAIFCYDMLGTKELARDFALNRVAEGIIVVDEEGTIGDFNNMAKELIPSIDKDPNSALSELHSLIAENKTIDVDGRKFTPKENILTDNDHEIGKVYILSDDTAHYRHAEQLTREMMFALSKTVDAKDHYTNGHSERVAKYAKEIARRMGKSEEEQEKIYEMGLLHDIGKIGVSEEIINKTSRLTDVEFAQIKKHTEIGSAILSQITAMPELGKGARNHHERYDGRGYPDGLAGEAIPEAARIICVADCYDAMTSTRTYSTPKPQEVVRAEIVRCKGSQFDPMIADVMLTMIDDDKEYKMHE
ncbi:MAG: HD domain-containing protein [Treponema sp.]|nr:HD domain-containing protein [Treponema sp.]